MSYAWTKRFDRPLPEMEERVRRALAGHGFGVLSEIDVAATLREKLGVEREPYKILGACNPGIASRALEHEPGIGVMLPCNVVLYTEGGQTVVAFADPHAMLGVAGAEGLEEIAGEAAALLREAFADLG